MIAWQRLLDGKVAEMSVDIFVTENCLKMTTRHLAIDFLSRIVM